MKTNLYFLFTSLLMAACITSYGQEIVSEFTLNNGIVFTNTDIMECSDGTLLTGISFHNSDYEDYGLLVCKTSQEGQLVDSAAFEYGSLFSINGAIDSYVIPSLHWDEADSTEIFNMTFIDANLNVTETVSVPFPNGIDPQHLALDEWIFTPENEFIISYWTDFEVNDYWTDYAVFHLMRISLDGTILSENETDRILPPNWSNMHPGDSALTYYSQGFGIFEESPRHYYKMGGYIGTNNSHPWPLIAYFFDEDLNLTDTIVYENLAEDIYYDWVGHEHLIPLEKNTYLMAGQIHYPDGVYRSSLVKYDMDHNPLIIANVESAMAMGNPIKTVVVDENTIFHAYQCHPSGYSYAIGLTRLDNDLNTLWNITLPGGQFNYAYGQCLKVLQNGDVAIAFATSFGNSGDRLHLYIIHDGYDAIPETVIEEHPFSLYPNPVKGQMTLSFVEGIEPESVELYDLSGRLVNTKRDGLESIDMSAMPAGVYVIRVITTDGMSYHNRVIKE